MWETPPRAYSPREAAQRAASVGHSLSTASPRQGAPGAGSGGRTAEVTAGGTSDDTPVIPCGEAEAEVRIDREAQPPSRASLLRSGRTHGPLLRVLPPSCPGTEAPDHWGCVRLRRAGLAPVFTGSHAAHTCLSLEHACRGQRSAPMRYAPHRACPHLPGFLWVRGPRGPTRTRPALRCRHLCRSHPGTRPVGSPNLFPESFRQPCQRGTVHLFYK